MEIWTFLCKISPYLNVGSHLKKNVLNAISSRTKLQGGFSPQTLFSSSALQHDDVGMHSLDQSSDTGPQTSSVTPLSLRVSFCRMRITRRTTTWSCVILEWENANKEPDQGLLHRYYYLIDALKMKSKTSSLAFKVNHDLTLNLSFLLKCWPSGTPVTLQTAF